MVTAFVATVLILGIATYQAVHGLYSALIMAVLTTLSALTALAFYEPLGVAFLYERMPAYADGVALISLFLLVLLGTRELADRFLRGNIVLGVWPDRIGGGALGLFAGIVFVGMLSIGLQLLPFGRSAAGYRPCDESLVRRASLWMFYPDDFVLSMAKRLSVGALGNGRPFADAHDDLVQEAYATRNRLITDVIDSDKEPIPTLVGELNGREGDFRVLAMYNLSNPGDLDRTPKLKQPIDRIQQTLKELLPPGSAEPTIVVVRVAVREGACDQDAFWRLPATHFRLVDPEGNPHYPVGYLFVLPTHEINPDYQPRLQDTNLINWNMITPPRKAPRDGMDTAGRPRIADLVVQRIRTDGVNGELFIDWVFCLPPNLLTRPSLGGFHMAFRGRLRAELLSKTLIPGLPSADLALRHAFLLPRVSAAGSPPPR
ncbi:MAG: CvpA family protein [Planctomycetota bacterium]